MKIFAIKIIDTNIQEFDDIPYCLGEIQIGNFRETFTIPVDYWTMQDYEKQWRAGIERIKMYDQSCLIFEMEDPTKAPLANTWVLYKDGDVVHIQNHLLFGKRFSTMLKKKGPFTMQTCYNFIKTRNTISKSTGMKISEWDIDLEAVLHGKVSKTRKQK
jgi:hypothetical protein